MEVPKGKRFHGIWTDSEGKRFELFVHAKEVFHYWSFIRPEGTTKKLEACYDPEAGMTRACTERPDNET